MKSKIQSSSLFGLYAACQGFYADVSCYSQLTAWSEAPRLHWSAATKGVRETCREFGEASLFHTYVSIASAMKCGKQENTLNVPSPCQAPFSAPLWHRCPSGLISFPTWKKKMTPLLSCSYNFFSFFFCGWEGELMRGIQHLAGNSLSFWFSNEIFMNRVRRNYCECTCAV